MSTDGSHPIPNRTLLTAHTSNATAKRLVAKLVGVESLGEVQSTPAAVAPARVTAVEKELESADAEVGTRAHDGGECAAVDDTGTFREAAGAARYRLACDKRERREGDRRSGQSTVRTGRTARRRMSGDDGLERLSSEQLHDLAVRRAKRHIDVPLLL